MKAVERVTEHTNNNINYHLDTYKTKTQTDLPTTIGDHRIAV